MVRCGCRRSVRHPFLPEAQYAREDYRVLLSDDDRAVLYRLVSAGTAPARQITHARILLKADEGPDGPAWKDAAIADAWRSIVPPSRGYGGGSSKKGATRPCGTVRRAPPSRARSPAPTRRT